MSEKIATREAYGKALAELAVNHPAAFKAICDKVKK